MDSIYVIPRLFKYLKAQHAITNLETKELRWGSPDSFNDPFEFESPFEYGFEWDELKETVIDRLGTILTQPEEPELFPDNPVASQIPAGRLRFRGHDFKEGSDWARPITEKLVGTLKAWSVADKKLWDELKQTYRVLSLSRLNNHILMWSHYADWHRGVVLEFQPIIGSEILSAQPVRYSKEVPVATKLDGFVKYLTGAGPVTRPKDPYWDALLTKSSVWFYEDEWRVITPEQHPAEYSFRKFLPDALVGIYFGCKIPSASRERIIGLASNWPTRVSLFQMQDERIRYELTAVPISSGVPSLPSEEPSR